MVIFVINLSLILKFKFYFKKGLISEHALFKNDALGSLKNLVDENHFRNKNPNIEINKYGLIKISLFNQICDKKEIKYTINILES